MYLRVQLERLARENKMQQFGQLEMPLLQENLPQYMFQHSQEFTKLLGVREINQK